MGNALRAAMRGLTDDDLLHTTSHLVEQLAAEAAAMGNRDQIGPIDVGSVIDPLVAAHGVAAVRLFLCGIASRDDEFGHWCRAAVLSDDRLRLPSWSAVDTLSISLAWMEEQMASLQSAYDVGRTEGLEALREALQAGHDPAGALTSLNALAESFAAVLSAMTHAAAADAPDLDVEPSLEGLARALAALQQIQADRAAHGHDDGLLAKIELLSGLAGPEHYAEPVASLVSLSHALRDGWPPAEEDARHAEGLGALCDLIGAVEGGAPDIEIDALSERLRELLPAPLASLALPAARGKLRLALAEEAGTEGLAPPPPDAEEGAFEEEDRGEEGGAARDSAPADAVATADVAGGQAGAERPAASDLTEALATALEAQNEIANEQLAPAKVTGEVALDEGHGSRAADEASDAQAVDVDALRRRLLGDRRFGLAYWLQRAHEGETPRAEALRLVALASGIVRPTGECAAACQAGFEQLNLDDLDGDSSFQLLVLAAAVRAALRAPYSRASDVLQELGMVLVRDERALAFIQQLAMVTRSGLFVGEDIASVAEEEEVLEAELQAVTHQAATALESWPHRTIKYHAATIVWKHWLAEGGVLSDLLAVVADDRRADLDAVTKQAIDLRHPATQSDLIDSTDAELRKGPRPGKITAKARDRLLSGIDEALDVVSQWVDVVQRLHRHEANRAGMVNRQIEDLRRLAREAEGPLRQLIEAWEQADDEDIRAAGAVARWLFREVLAAVGTGAEPPRVERGPDEVLGWELLLADQVGVVGFRPTPTHEVTPEVVQEIERQRADWAGALERRLARKDYVGADQIVAVLAERSLGLDADELDGLMRAMEEQFSTDSRAVERRFLRVEAALARARAERYLPEVEAQVAISALNDLHPLDLDAHPRRDLRRIEAGLADIEEAIEQGRRAAVAERERRLDALGARSEPGATDRIRQQIDAGDLAAADELLELAELGEPLPDPPVASLALEEFYPDAVEGLAGIPLDREVVKACEAGAAIGPLDFSVLADGSRDAAVAALEAWAFFDSVLEQGTNVLRSLRSLFLVLGIEFSDHRAPKASGQGSGRHWIELSGVRRLGKAMVPDMGSQAAGELRVLVTMEHVATARLLEWVEQDASGKPVIVLFRGALSVGDRRDLAKATHRKPRPLVVIDEPVYLYLLTHGPELRLGDYERTMRLTLPFAGLNPFRPFSLGQVPPEMFYGRKRELDAVMDGNGPSFVYGGRQLGKSALLRTAARRFSEDSTDRASVYIDLNYEGVGTFRRASELWDVLAASLAEQGVFEPMPKRAADSFTWVQEQLLSWLGESPQRRMLLLLDESDRFLDEDAQGEFSVTQRLRGLMDDTGRRFKVVLAGLHLVQRFERIPNQPLVHLAARPIVIGPLDAQSGYELIQRPLDALGYRFDDPDLVTRILAYTNFQASIIQLVGHALTDHLNRRPLTPSSPPYVVSEADLDKVLGQRDLLDEIKRRFEWTISLDDRYLVIAYVMALNARESGSGLGLSARDLREQCEEVWPAGFSTIAPDQMQTYLTEMVGLGVLARTGSDFRLRSPHVLSLLGDDDEILAHLAGDFVLPEEFDLGRFRRPWGEQGRPSPTTATQDAELLGPGPHVIVGSNACGADISLASISEAAGGASSAPVAASVDDLRVLMGQRDLRGRLADLRAVGEDEVSALLSDLFGGKARKRSVTVLLGPRQLSAWQAGLDHEELLASTVFLGRWDDLGLLTWCRSRDVQLTVSEAATVVDITGGWLAAIEPWLDLRRAGSGAEAAAREVMEGFAAEDEGGTLLSAAGLDQGSVLRAAWELLVEWGELTRSDFAGELAELSDDASAIIDQLELLQLVVVATTSDGEVELRPEPAMARFLTGA